jgi:phage RecT family recombinase
MSLKDRVKNATTAPAAARPADSETVEQQEQTPPPVTDLALQNQTFRFLEERRTYITQALPAYVDEGYFIQTAMVVLDALAAKQKKDDDPITGVFPALMEAARFGLVPDGKQAAIVPFKGRATFQPMYEGFIDLMYRSGKVQSVHFGWINEGDTWDYDAARPAPDDFSHRPNLLAAGSKDAVPILAYAFAWMKGGGRSQIVFLNRPQAEEIRDKYSKAYQNAERFKKYDSTWHTSFDAMWAKSAVRRLAKRVPTSPELVELLKADERAESGTPAIVREVPVETGSEVRDAEVIDTEDIAEHDSEATG